MLAWAVEVIPGLLGMCCALSEAESSGLTLAQIYVQNSADITGVARLGDGDLGAVSHWEKCQPWECTVSPAGLKGSRRGAGGEAHR